MFKYIYLICTLHLLQVLDLYGQNHFHAFDEDLQESDTSIAGHPRAEKVGWIGSGEDLHDGNTPW
jgi:hypothetical protein